LADEEYVRVRRHPALKHCEKEIEDIEDGGDSDRYVDKNLLPWLYNDPEEENGK
jgi:hypothetical protein